MLRSTGAIDDFMAMSLHGFMPVCHSTRVGEKRRRREDPATPKHSGLRLRRAAEPGTDP